jgi:D-beta-D-heptose 7-phosphate kinase/D-beta-D-heptose 1-phosphate adenosyltransferase
MIENEELPNTEEAIQKYWIEFVNTYKLNLVITRWSKWAILITKEGQLYSLSTNAKQVFDVTGAWDTFLAAIVYALSKWNDLKSAVEIGNKASWIVVGKLGTATVTPEELWF